MTTAYDPETAYRDEWRYHDFIEDGDYQPPATGEVTEQAFALKVKRLDATDAGFEPIALALGLSAEDTVLLVWNPLDANGVQQEFDPEANGMMILDDASWVINNLRTSRFGHWEMGVTKATENASP